MRILLALLTLGILLLLLIHGCGRTFSEGDQIGTVTCVEVKGIVLKATVAEVFYGGPGAQRHASYFPVWDAAVIAQLKQAADRRQDVRVHFTRWLIAPMKNNNDLEITAVEILPSITPDH